VRELESQYGQRPWASGAFTTTHWSVVLEARKSSSLEADKALEALCRKYWFPLYCFVRRRGYGPADSEDLTQGFFAKLMEKRYLDQVQLEKGKFRSFLLTALAHYLSDERDRATALKRGGAMIHIDIDDAEHRYGNLPADALTPEKVYERKWVNTLLERALERLREEGRVAGKADYCEQLMPFVNGEKAEVPWASLASELKVTQAAVKSALYRLRQRYREVLRAEVAETVSEPWEVDEELRYLIRVFDD
jgi:RNA polymerase sigma factor (sigma-70 family)